MKYIYKFLLLFSIIMVAIVLRFWQLGAVPVSPDWDEVSIGYNANSILKTGRDEYGTFLPMSIRSFGDYKPPLYTYLTVPSVALFGLSVWSTRLPSAVMGVLAVIGVYFMVRELLKDTEQKTINNKQENGILFIAYCPMLSAALLAISPWHIQFSRIAFEANIGVTINIWAVTVFLIGLRKHIFLPISAFLFALGMYAYHSERIFLPLLVIWLVFVYRKRIFTANNRLYLIGACIAGFVALLPLIPVLLDKTSIQRLSGTSVMSQQTRLLARTVNKLEEDRRVGDIVGSILDNRRFVWVTSVISGYLSHFSLKWLFLTGDYYRHHAPDMGLLYLWELPFLLYGMFIVWKNFPGPVGYVLFGWLLLSPVAAAPTTDLPHAVRTLVFLPVYQVFTAVGIASYIGSVANSSGREKIAGLLAGISILGAAVFNFAYYMGMYFTHQNAEFSRYWQYGYKEVVDFAEKNKSKYEKIVVSSSLDQAYIFFLFYTGYDPARYLASGGTKPLSDSEVKNTFDTYVFKNLDWSKDVCDGKILYIVSPMEISRGNVLEVRYLNGEPAIELADKACKSIKI